MHAHKIYGLVDPREPNEFRVIAIASRDYSVHVHAEERFAKDRLPVSIRVRRMCDELRCTALGGLYVGRKLSAADALPLTHFSAH
jgi:hypothetical protein